VSIHLRVAWDGVEAMAFLRHEGAHVHAPRPQLILLDLNLPKMVGRQVLAHIKENDSLRAIPIVILTTSDAEVDILKSYLRQATCYLTKPVQLDEFERLVKSVNEFLADKDKVAAVEAKRLGRPKITIDIARIASLRRAAVAGRKYRGS
jgi:chemotaxis family two-component system response regulator Rcp1